MELAIGNSVKYHFPNPKNISKKCFVGIVEYIGETFITLKDETNTILKISYKNFHLLEPNIQVNKLSFSTSENFFG
jgi:hypothetical protein